MCYRWLHSKSNTMYSNLNAWYTIPVIVISTLTGTANFAQERVPIEYQNYFVMCVGAFNLLAGIITTIQQFLKITQLNEAHRVSSISWDKFYRNVKIELAKHPQERIGVTHMIKMSKEEFDRLMETSPNIPDKIIKLFNTSFKKSTTFAKITKPEICDILISTDVYRNPWFNDEHKEQLVLLNNKTQVVKENIQPSWKWDKSSEKEISSPIKLPMFSTYIYSTMITMLIAGFWHGASWTFVFWGVMHGIALCANKFYQVYISKKIKPKHGWVFYKKYISNILMLHYLY